MSATSYRVLQPMRFILDFGPSTETLDADTVVAGAQHLQPDDARALATQRKWHKERGVRGSLVAFEWHGKVRFGVTGADVEAIR